MGSQWYLVRRDVMRGPLWAIRATHESRVRVTVSTLSPLPRRKPSLTSVAVCLNNGGRVALWQAAKLGGRPEPLYPFSPRRSPSALPRCGSDVNIQSHQRNPTHLPDSKTGPLPDPKIPGLAGLAGGCPAQLG